MSKEITTKQQTNTIAHFEYEINGKQILLNETILNAISNNNSYINDGEKLLFCETCKALQINPILKEAHLVKYDNSKPAQIIIGVATYKKIADSHPEYNGYESGVIVKQENGNIASREGEVKYTGEVLVGAWCKVYRKDRRPTYVSINFSEFSKGQSTWKTSPCMMLVKTAEVRALRSAFPSSFEGTYSDVEIEAQNVQENANKTEYDIDQAMADGADVVVQDVTDDIPSFDMGGDTILKESVAEEDITCPPHIQYDESLAMAKAHIFNFGQYKGRTLGEIEAEDKPYMDWIAQKANTPEVKNYAQLIIANRGL